MKEPYGSPLDVISFLRGVPLFAGLDEGALRTLVVHNVVPCAGCNWRSARAKW